VNTRENERDEWVEKKDNNNRRMKREWKWTNGIEGRGEREEQTERKKERNKC